jgi:hypothetical protein
VPPPKRSITFDAAFLETLMPILFAVAATCVSLAIVAPVLLRLVAPRWARR